MKVVALEAELWEVSAKYGMSSEDAESLVREYAEEAAALLPSDFAYLNLVINPVKPDMVIPETGVMGMAYSDEYISLTFDALLPYGHDATKSALRATVFHEMVHATTFAHDPWQAGAIFGAITEGLATVFERDYAGSEPPWGKYEDDRTMKAWYEEIKSLPKTTEKQMQYFVDHDDGRKWIVYKVGAWAIDKLLANGEDLPDLMRISHHEIIMKLEAL